MTCCRTARFASHLLSFLALSLGFALVLGPAGASAQDGSGTVGIHVGALVVSESGATHIRPTLRAEASLRLAGPLYGGAYLQGTGAALPLANAQVAGGLAATLRFDVSVVKLFATAEAGRISLPSESQGSIGAWSAGGVAGVDVPMLDGKLWLDLRLGHTWLFGADSPVLGTSAWSGGAGLTVPLL